MDVRVVTQTGVPIPKKGASMRQKIIHEFGLLTAESSKHFTINGRKASDVAKMLRTIASQQKMRIITKVEDDGCRVWLHPQSYPKEKKS